MNQTTSIIVYRNPMEAAFWENGGPAIMLSMFALLAVFLLLYHITEWYCKNFTKLRYSSRNQVSTLIGGAFTAILGLFMFSKVL